MNKPPLLHKLPVYLRILIFVAIILSTMILVLIFGFALAAPIFGQDMMKNISLMGTSTDPGVIAMAKYFQIVSQFGIFLIPTILFAFLDGRNIGSYLKINSCPHLKTVVFAILAILVVVPLINFIAEINQQMSFPSFMNDIETWMRDTEDSAAKMTTTFLNVSTIEGLLINVLMMAIIPAIGEEFLFRGILQKLFQQWSRNSHIAIILSAFLFSAIHMQFYGFIPRFFLGIFLGYSFIWSGSLWVPIVIHFINNFTAVLFSYFAGPGMNNNFIDTVGTGDSAFIPVIISAIFSSAFIYLIYYFERKKRLNNLELTK
jgi:uncharacterized protein